MVKQLGRALCSYGRCVRRHVVQSQCIGRGNDRGTRRQNGRKFLGVSLLMSVGSPACVRKSQSSKTSSQGNTPVILQTPLIMGSTLLEYTLKALPHHHNLPPKGSRKLLIPHGNYHELFACVRSDVAKYFYGNVVFTTTKNIPQS